MRRAVIIVNRHAAAGRDASPRLDHAVTGLRRLGFRTEVQFTGAPGHAIGLARETGTGPDDLIVAAGGDGTVNEVVYGRLQSDPGITPVAVLPLGTGNDVALLLGTQSDDRFLAAIEAGSRKPWDILSVRAQPESGAVDTGGPRAALLFAAVGFASDLLRATTPRVKRLFGPKLCYTVGFFRALLAHRCPHLHVRIGDRTWDGPMVVALAANSVHAGGGMMHVAPGARVDDGEMNVSLIRATGRLAVARQFLRLVRGTHVHHPNVQYFPATSMEIDGTPAQAVAVDGELIGQTPVRVEVLPRAVSFIAAAPGR